MSSHVPSCSEHQERYATYSERSPWIDDPDEQEEVLNMLIVANGRYYAAGLKLAPNAQLDDGFFDIV